MDRGNLSKLGEGEEYLMQAWLSDDTNLLDRLRAVCDGAGLGLVSIDWLLDSEGAPTSRTFVGEVTGRRFCACFRQPLLVSERRLLQQLCHEHDELYRARLALLEMVHELGNPLSVLDAHLQLMRAGQVTSARWSAVFRALAHINQRLHQETDRHRAQWFNIVEVINEAIEDLGATSGTPCVIWNVPQHPVFLNWQRERAQQILFNLLKNAVEASQSQGVIDIAILSNDHECTIAVKNRGQCIPDDAVHVLFAPGWSSKSSGHLGMGLAVSQKLAERAGARLEYSDAIGFVVRIPVSDALSPTPIPGSVMASQR
ncbi:MAG: hypothetical protein C7B45_01370 [Sulfobacillus acidophilus]|uniref:Histidine kinase domain-containing protein n=1 Tax=Sulfobacillus acidophilus TaxID=53633 RepID=A0A2T2WP27_9FIRM|nr:MAG: hypothetical protein C7B45_01370 [Sulfobacillus acidophilus]